MSEKYLGESIGKLGFGFMRLPKKGDAFDYETINAMVDGFLAAGFTYFDTAYVYPGSEEALRDTLVRRHPRSGYQIATKLNMMTFNEPSDMPRIFETSLSRMGTDYIDYYLLHGMSEMSANRAEKMGAWNFVRRLKDEGRIRHYGFSFHDSPEMLDKLLTDHPDAEFVQLQINYLDWDSVDIRARELFDTARRHNKPVIIMEPVRGGMLANTGSPIEKILKSANPGASMASWAMRFAASLDGLVTVLSGMSSLEQLHDNIQTVQNLRPLDAAELKVLDEATAVLRAIPRVPCTGCKYCLEDCPQNINIPELLDIYSDYLVYNTTANSEFPFSLATRGRGKPSDCITCRVCEAHCPQHIEISDFMGLMVPLYER